MTFAPVANFHGLGTPPIKIDADEAPYWLSREQYVEALALLRASGEAFLVTFDDGNMSDLEIGLPELREGERAIVFACSDRIGQPGYLGSDELRAMAAMPGVTIGSHGAAHRSWRKAQGDERDREIAKSRKILEEASGAPVRDAGIPFGDYDRRVLSDLKRAGYERAFSSDGTPRLTGSDPIPRLSLRGDQPIADQVQRLLAGCNFASKVKQEARLRAKALLK